MDSQSLWAEATLIRVLVLNLHMIYSENNLLLCCYVILALTPFYFSSTSTMKPFIKDVTQVSKL